ncbi:hypothetical protein ACWF82_20445, partial [Nocardia sp. NPDC055053]
MMNSIGRIAVLCGAVAAPLLATSPAHAGDFPNSCLAINNQLSGNVVIELGNPEFAGTSWTVAPNAFDLLTLDSGAIVNRHGLKTASFLEEDGHHVQALPTRGSRESA